MADEFNANQISTLLDNLYRIQPSLWDESITRIYHNGNNAVIVKSYVGCRVYDFRFTLPWPVHEMMVCCHPVR